MAEARSRGGDVVYYDERGPQDGPVMVFIEGIGAHCVAWREEFLEPYAREGFRVIRLDNRDVGRSAHYPGLRYTVDDMAGDVVDLLDHLEQAAAHVVGQSMGGMIAQALALNHPSRVLSLALFYTTPSTQHFRIPLEDLKFRGASATASRAEAVERYLSFERECATAAYPLDEQWKRALGGVMWDRERDPDGIRRQAEAIETSPDRTGALRRIRVPTVAVHGDQDHLIDDSGSRAIATSVPDAWLEIVPGLGHQIPAELWPRFTRLVIDNARRQPEHPVVTDLDANGCATTPGPIGPG